MKKNVGGTWRRIHGLGIVRLPRVVLLAIALTVSAGIPLAIPGPASAQQPVNNDLTALEVAADQVFLPPTTTSVQAGTTQSGTRAWDFFLGNNSQTSVTNPTITVNSGWSPSLFPEISSFPVTGSQGSLAPGEVLSALPTGALNSLIPVSFSLGYNSTRQASPGVIPVGGTQQTLTVTVTPIDPRYQSGGTPDSPFGIFNIIVDSQVAGVSVVSTTGPNNLNQGEQLQPITGPPGSLFAWQLGLTQTNKTYTFTAVLNVPNATGAPFTYSPGVSIDGGGTTFLCQACLGSAVTVADGTLDGNVPGSGSATFSVAETSHTWTSSHSDAFDVFYQGTTQTPAFNFAGFFPPVDNPPVLNQVNRGQAIPMKFSLGGNYGLNIIAPGYPTATQISCSTGTTVNSGTLTDTAGSSGLQYNSSTGTYTYVWKTSKSWAGTCQQFDLRLNDGTDHTADFQFK
jgi:hypothetical protein